MEKTPNCCTLASLVALVVLVSLPARSGCEEDTYKSLTEAKLECCVRGDTPLKRFKDIDYDSFVGLLGKRSAAQPNSDRNSQMPRKNEFKPDKWTRSSLICGGGEQGVYLHSAQVRQVLDYKQHTSQKYAQTMVNLRLAFGFTVAGV